MMEYKSPKWWFVALIIVASYLALIITFVILSVIADKQLTVSLVVFCSILLIGLTLYNGYKSRQITYLPITFSVVGIVFILLGSIIWVPYTTWQTFRKDTSWDLTYAFCSLSPFDYSDRPSYQNGSLRLITLPANDTKIYSFEGNAFIINASIIQISISTSNVLTFQIAETDYNGVVEVVFLKQTVNTGFLGNVGDFWREYFWTPPYNLFHLELVFENPSDSDAVFYVRVVEYFLKTTDEQSIINYRTFADSYFAYIGILLNAAAVVLYAYRKGKRQQSSPELV